MKLSDITRAYHNKFNIIAAAVIAAITGLAGKVAELHANRLYADAEKNYDKAEALADKAEQLKYQARLITNMARDVESCANDAYRYAGEAYDAVIEEISNLKGL